MHARPQSPLPSSNGAIAAVAPYEKYLVHTAQELVREIARHFEKLDGSPDEPNAKYNSNRAWASLDNLGRIEL